MRLKLNNSVICTDRHDPWQGSSWETDAGDLIEITQDRDGFHGRLNEREEIRNQSSLKAVAAWVDGQLAGRITAVCVAHGDE